MFKRTLIVIVCFMGVVFVPYFIGKIPILRIEYLPYWVNGIAVILVSLVGLLVLWAIVEYIINGNPIKN